VKGITPAAEAPIRSATLILAVLTAMNLLNYVDRYILASVLKPVQASLGIEAQDGNAGLLGSIFLVSYCVFSPLVGWFGDRFSRKYLIAGGVAVWSLATLMCGWARSYEEMLFWRATLGVGEAAYAVLAPGIIGDLFARDRRNRALTLFYLAIPIGAALGYSLGGGINTATGDWRWSFRVVGFPGLLFALLALFLPEPRRGATELHGETGAPANPSPPTAADYFGLGRNRSYVLNTLGMAMMSFALGGLQFWAPKYLAEGDGAMPLDTVTYWLGIVVAGSSIVGFALGGFLAERLSRRFAGAYFLVSGFGMIVAAPFILLALMSRAYPVVYFGIFAGLTFGVFNFGPSNTILVNVTPPRIRAAGVAVNMFLIHVLGDIPSQTLMGGVSDWTQRAGASPKDGLFWGLMLTIPSLLLSGLFFCLGTRFLKADQEAVLQGLREKPSGEKELFNEI
jgi:MFS family permease